MNPCCANSSTNKRENHRVGIRGTGHARKAKLQKNSPVEFFPAESSPRQSTQQIRYNVDRTIRRMTNEQKKLLGPDQMNLCEQLAHVWCHPDSAVILFFDWHCRPSTLPRRADALFRKLRQVVGSPRFDPAGVYVCFKNNCPAYGCLYDDFRICDRDSGRVLFCVIPSSGQDGERGRARVWGRNKAGQMVEMAAGNWQAILSFFEGSGAQMNLL